MGDWTSQNWTKRDGRNNQQEQEQQQEKKVTYKTAAELAVKKPKSFFFLLSRIMQGLTLGSLLQDHVVKASRIIQVV